MIDHVHDAGTRRALVVGAGISGLTAAILLRRRGWHVEVWEADSRAGGLLAPVDVGGQQLDRGSHRVHLDADPLLFALTPGAAWQRRPRRGRLLLGGRHICYPPRLGQFLWALGPTATLDMAWGWATRRRPWANLTRWEAQRGEAACAFDDDEGFEAFVKQRAGNAAYARFYRPYVEKVWGEPASVLSRSVAKQRVSMRTPIADLLRFSRPVRAATSHAATSHAGAHSREATHPDPRGAFLYPLAGMAGVVEELTAQLQRLDVRIALGQRADWPALHAARGFDRIFYSGHVADLLHHVAPHETTHWRHRGLYLLHLLLDRDSAMGGAAMSATAGQRHDARATTNEVDTFYAPESHYWFGRVSQPAQFSPRMFEHASHAAICVEIPEGRWGPDEDFLRRLPELRRQLIAAGVIHASSRIVGAVQTFVPRVYPLYKRGWLPHWRRGLRALAAADPRIVAIGRQGLFLHCNLDHCVRIAHAAVDATNTPGDHEDWLRMAETFLDLRVRD